MTRFAHLVTAFVASGVPFASASPAGEPVLRFTTLAPVTVEGSGFRSGERLKVVLSLNGSPRRKHVRASTTGAFTARFSGAVVRDRCNSDVWVHATGIRGSRASAKLPQPLCPPALAPPSQ